MPNGESTFVAKILQRMYILVISRDEAEEAISERKRIDMDPVHQILAVEKAWTTAHLTGDLQTIAQLMADEYVKIQPDGSVATKVQTLATFEPDLRWWETARGDDYDVRIYGDTAVVIGRWTAKGMNNGQPFDYAARFLSVYVRRDGQWKMVAEQSTDIQQPN